MKDVSLLEKLSSVTHFSIDAMAKNEWQASGEGSVKVEKLSQQSLVWREKGAWDKSLNNIEFSNVYRWTLVSKDELQLEHLRYGDDQPVQLVALQVNDAYSWTSIKPHLCGRDEYNLAVKIENKQLFLFWNITGPKKDQLSTICYR